MGCPGKFKLEDESKPLLFSACANLKISGYCCPTPEQAVALARMLDIPTQYGSPIFEDILTHVLYFVEEYVNLNGLPNGFKYQRGKYYWRKHTQQWDWRNPGEYKDMMEQYSAEFDGYWQPSKLSRMMTVRGAMDLMYESEIWDDEDDDEDDDEEVFKLVSTFDSLRLKQGLKKEETVKIEETVKKEETVLEVSDDEEDSWDEETSDEDGSSYEDGSSDEAEFTDEESSNDEEGGSGSSRVKYEAH